MKRVFKQPLWVRAISFLMLLISIPYAIFEYSGLHDLLFVIISLWLVIEINYTSVSVTDEELIIKIPFKKIAIYKLLDINRIEETKGFICYLKIFLNTRKKPVNLLTGEMNIFIMSILESLKDKKKLELDQNDKWINFLPL